MKLGMIRILTMFNFNRICTKEEYLGLLQLHKQLDKEHMMPKGGSQRLRVGKSR